MKGENSVERATRITRELEQKTENLRKEISYCNDEIKLIDLKIKDLVETKKSFEEHRSDLEDEKTDVLFTRLALAGFINSGGGLDMLPED